MRTNAQMKRILTGMNTDAFSLSPHTIFTQVAAATAAGARLPTSNVHTEAAAFSAQLQSALGAVQTQQKTEVELQKGVANASSPAQAPIPAPMPVDGKAYLLPSDADTVAANGHKPSVAAFMQATGANFKTAANVLSGVVGSNTDYRNWPAIMESADPLAAARAAAGAMYQSDLPYGAPGTPALAKDTVLAQSGPYTVTETDHQHQLWLTASNGQPLRQLSMNAPKILAAAQDFGFDTAPLAAVADQLAAKGVVLNGGSTGLDLKALAAGKLGMPHDWTQDPLVHLKGESAWSALQANRALAAQFGIKASAS